MNEDFLSNFIEKRSSVLLTVIFHNNFGVKPEKWENNCVLIVEASGSSLRLKFECMDRCLRKSFLVQNKLSYIEERKNRQINHQKDAPNCKHIPISKN